MDKLVKGFFFVDYVRMIKSRKDVDWRQYLSESEMSFLSSHINNDNWYPFDSFERMGLGILDKIADGKMEAAYQWGRGSIDHLVKDYPSLIAEENPAESLIRFQVLRGGFFDFHSIEVDMVLDNRARLKISYGMGKVAERAAVFQTLGFFTRLLELSGANKVKHDFPRKAWEGDPDTLMELHWD